MTAKKKTVKKSQSKKSDKKSNSENVTIKPVTDSTGVVVMKSVDDPGEVSDNEGVKLKAHVDKDTGVITMVPDSD
jgi:hypothetical protein